MLKVEDLQRQNQQIDQEIAKRQQEIQQLLVAKIENNGRIKQLRDIEEEEKRKEAEKKEEPKLEEIK